GPRRRRHLRPRLRLDYNGVGGWCGRGCGCAQPRRCVRPARGDWLQRPAVASRPAPASGRLQGAVQRYVGGAWVVWPTTVCSGAFQRCRGGVVGCDHTEAHQKCHGGGAGGVGLKTHPSLGWHRWRHWHHVLLEGDVGDLLRGPWLLSSFHVG
ncbi:hypothetical protein SETIT_9G166100v2, partial [Setaria italica]